MAEPDSARPILLDVSRLVWRAWRGNLPTGIDRVCLAYARHFGHAARAVIQRKGMYFVLSPSHSDRLFELLTAATGPQRSNLLKLAVVSAPTAIGAKTLRDSIYLNVGHTGLDEDSLPKWIDRHGLRAVYMIHDLIPLTHPQFCRPAEEAKHARRMRNVLASATGIIGNSQATLDDLASFAGTQRQSLPASIAAWIGGGEFPNPAPRKPRSRPNFITVGTIEGRKNHVLLLEVWRELVARLGHEAPSLTIVGQRGWQAESAFEQLDNLGDLQGFVRELNTCADTELASLIAEACALLMPSFAEGFGLPVFEALELGTRVIASDLPVYREIAGSIPTYLGPEDVDGWVEAILNLSQDGAGLPPAPPHFRAPSWDEHFRKIEPWLATLQRFDRL